MTDLRPTIDRAVAAARILEKHLKPSALKPETVLSELLQCRAYARYEFDNPVRSFKIRGALNLLHHLTAGPAATPTNLVTASTGNHGAAMAFACQQYGVPLTVGVPVGCDQSKVGLIRQFEANLEFLGRDMDETKELLTDALPQESLFVEDGSSPEIYDGTSTIGLEITKSLPEVEVVFVPVGNGALIGGVGSILKEHNPDLEVVGVQSEAAPCMALSFQAGRPVDTPDCDTFASGIAVRIAIPEAVTLMLEVVDRMIVVSERALKEAVGLFFQGTGHLVEGAAAAALAGALQSRESIENRTICLIVSGANLDEETTEKSRLSPFFPRHKTGP